MIGRREDVIVALDVGTTKICALAGKINDEGEIELESMGLAPSLGLRKGVVINLDETIDSISKALGSVEKSCQENINRVFAGIAGSHIQGLNSRGAIAVSRSDHEITHKDINRVINAAKVVAIPPDRQLIHVLPQEFIIDEQNGIKIPLGMAGVRLEAEVYLVTGAVTSIQNIMKSISRSGFEVEEIVLGPLAASEAVLSEDEKKLGVVLIDIGGGTTDIVIYVDGNIKHVKIIPAGGELVTNDIAVGLRTPSTLAESLKKKEGSTLRSLDKDDEITTLIGLGDRQGKFPRRLLCEIIEARMEEIFNLVKTEIMKTGLVDLIAAGVVLTGGGSLLKGVTQMAEEIFNLPARIGAPHSLIEKEKKTRNPMFSVGVGLLQYALKSRQLRKTALKGNIFSRTVGRFREKAEEMF
ncbi:MAG: cell division protein FtsA [Candidatus Ratteibacteria bacterium]|nr:cell division protein FtsA [Candidatus Ratteibacteria bacterium]